MHFVKKKIKEKRKDFVKKLKSGKIDSICNSKKQQLIGYEFRKTIRCLALLQQNLDLSTMYTWYGDRFAMYTSYRDLYHQVPYGTMRDLMVP